MHKTGKNVTPRGQEWEAFTVLFGEAVVLDIEARLEGRFGDLRTRVLAPRLLPAITHAELVELRWGDLLMHPDRPGERLRIRGARGPRTIAVDLGAGFIFEAQQRGAISQGWATTDERPVFPLDREGTSRGEFIEPEEIRAIALAANVPLKDAQTAIVGRGALPAETIRRCIGDLDMPARMLTRLGAANDSSRGSREETIRTA